MDTSPDLRRISKWFFTGPKTGSELLSELVRLCKLLCVACGDVGRVASVHGDGSDCFELEESGEPSEDLLGDRSACDGISSAGSYDGKLLAGCDEGLELSVDEGEHPELQDEERA